jgi:hypothetical protein
MKKVLIVLAVLIVGCKDNNPVVIYVKDNNLRDSLYTIDFDIEKDQWINNVLNTEKCTRIISPENAIFKEHRIKFKSVEFYVMDIMPNDIMGKYPNGKLFMFQRCNSATIHRVSEQTEKRIHDLLFK